MNGPNTRPSLLVKLCDSAQHEAWEEFVAIYQFLIYRLARQKGFQHADACDLCQEVLTVVGTSTAVQTCSVWGVFFTSCAPVDHRFVRRQPGGVSHRITNDDPRPVRAVNADIPQWLQDIIDRLLSKDKDLRFQTAPEVADVLSQWLAYLQQPEVAAKPMTPDPAGHSRFSKSFNDRTSKWLAAVAGFVFVFAGILVTLELNKGTLTIECERDGVPIRIMKDDNIHRKLTVDRGATSTRISAGEYVVEIDGPADGLEVKDGAIVISRRGAALATIVQIEPETGNGSDVEAEVVVAEHGDKEAVQRTLDEVGDLSGAVQIEFVEGHELTVVRGRKEDVDRVISAISKLSSGKADDAAGKRESRVANVIEQMDVDRVDRPAKEQLRLAFRDMPWADVLHWIAQQTDWSFDLERVPSGTFSFEDSSRTYSPAEAFELINEKLYRKGVQPYRRDHRQLPVKSCAKWQDVFRARSIYRVKSGLEWTFGITRTSGS